MSLLPWQQVLALLAEANDPDGDERRILLVLADRAFHVREVLSGTQAGGDGLLGFVVYQDDPDLAKRSDETSLLFVRPEQVLRIQVLGYDAQADGRQLGFSPKLGGEEDG